ncbi:MAG: hypothetical protein AMDU3_IPLC00004G0479 [Thermoplasmatales archaeon I-plasma]|nr:MAG: hypothetical protein AMDU3_IPLC00004G0479 [Thermoplasmatales archaeon I-plasma]
MKEKMVLAIVWEGAFMYSLQILLTVKNIFCRSNF